MSQFIETETVCQLSRASRGEGLPGWNLEIKDKRSRDLILRLELSDADLGALLGTVPVDVEKVRVGQSPNIGRDVEVISQDIPMERDLAFHQYDPEVWANVVATHAAAIISEGWAPSIDTVFNAHRHRSTPTYSAYTVTFRRWVSRA